VALSFLSQPGLATQGWPPLTIHEVQDEAELVWCVECI
jgi:hypothetical protein